MRRFTRVLRSPTPSWTIPTFLCPGLSKSSLPTTSQLRRLTVESEPRDDIVATLKGLPLTCPGCGAYSQTHGHDQAGFYSGRKPVRTFLSWQRQHEPEGKQDEGKQDGGKQDEGKQDVKKSSEPPTPICDRCHNLQHHNQGKQIEHPTIKAIQQMLSESPHKHNHVWHILDAADFPLSLIPKLHNHLTLTPQRSQNRRARHKRFTRSKADMSFIITRSDLLAPKKDQVDSMMQYLVEVLREAMGHAGEGVRLGNVRCVSSHRGWWTREVKEEVWERGGGQFMVGKVNVGKSALLETIYPKNRVHTDQHVTQPGRTEEEREQNIARLFGDIQADDQVVEESNLLPPEPVETAYPVMPQVSHLPGTTAAPIRLPFGKGKGELIDLPGLPRGDLERHVQEEHKASLVMRNREKPDQLTIKPGQSLVVSNLFRITPTTPDLVFLACPFIPLECHVTSTEKAEAILAQENFNAVKAVAQPGVESLVKSAGQFELDADVTKARAGPLTRSDAAKLRTQQLAFKVFSTDILIEGVGWIELVAQVRKSALQFPGFQVEAETSMPETPVPEPPMLQGDTNLIESDSNPQESSLTTWKPRITQGSVVTGFPTVEIFSPNGKHVGSRRPLGAWMLGGKRKKPVAQRSQRPRKSMKGVKKAEKREARALKAVE